MSCSQRANTRLQEGGHEKLPPSVLMRTKFKDRKHCFLDANENAPKRQKIDLLSSQTDSSLSNTDDMGNNTSEFIHGWVVMFCCSHEIETFSIQDIEIEIERSEVESYLLLPDSRFFQSGGSRLIRKSE